MLFIEHLNHQKSKIHEENSKNILINHMCFGSF